MDLPKARIALEHVPYETRPSTASSSTPASRAYAPADCVRISTNQYKQQELRNTCNFDIEAHWQDTNGGWNAWSISAGRSYIGGMPAVRAYACVKNDWLDKTIMMCKP